MTSLVVIILILSACFGITALFFTALILAKYYKTGNWENKELILLIQMLILNCLCFFFIALAFLK